RCPYCGNENDIPLGEDDAYLKANDFLAALAAENEAQAEATVAPEAEAVHCGNCGADTTVSPDRTADRCPYCASPLSKQNGYAFKLNVQAVLPFAITAEQALAIYRKWLASRWFAPNDFTRRATRGEAMNGIYMPYWTYDAATRTWYTGQRGDAYFTTRMVRVNRNGRFVNEPQQVRQIRWRPASGEVTVDFDDVLVPASQSLPSHLQHGLEPWQLRNLKPFRQEFLSGFITETYQIPLRDGFEHAKGRMEPEIDAAIRRDIGGDEQRITSKRSEYSGIAFKHILLPVWLSAYRYSGTTYRFMINAQTGEVSGDRPWSIWKIAAAVVAGLALLAAVWYAMGDGNGAFPVFYDGISGTGISLP
ncbi:MAG: primosomal protein N' (replication factor Y) - superfamily II helicase, partial [Planctomycetes bacterium]|nr:primosomal protein N' (replication factor Y) - superfamily II helicase [Planctomycetota bacterium]